MGIAHRTAARIMLKGVSQGKANEPLAMDTFPVTGIVETASLNSIITDSAPGAACYSTATRATTTSRVYSLMTPARPLTIPAWSSSASTSPAPMASRSAS